MFFPQPLPPHPPALAPLWEGLRSSTGKSTELGGNWENCIHKISCKKKKALDILQNLCCIYFKLRREPQRGHSGSLVGDWEGMSRKPISIYAGSTLHSFIMPFWLSNGLTLFQHSENAENSGHSPRLPGQVYGSFLEGMYDLSSQPVGRGHLETPSGDTTTMPRWRNACLNRRKWSALDVPLPQCFVNKF